MIKVYQLLAHGRWFSLDTLASSTTKTGCHDIAEILLKVALNTINQLLKGVVAISECAYLLTPWHSCTVLQKIMTFCFVRVAIYNNCIVMFLVLKVVTHLAHTLYIHFKYTQVEQTGTIRDKTIIN